LLRNITADDSASQQEQLADRIYPQDVGMGLQGLEEDIRVRLHKKRTYARLTFTVAPGMQLALGVYLNIHAAKKPAPRTLREGQYDIALKSNSKWVCKDSGKVLAPHDISTVQAVGCADVPMSREDMKQVKAVAEPGLVLLGFRDASCIKPWNSVKAPAFLFPQDQLIKGSSTAFTALHKQMLHKKKVGIARLVVRASAEPQLVALVPAPHVVDEATGRSIESNGIYAVALPWADDVRSGMRVAAAPAPVSDAAVEAASAAIDALTLPSFHPSQMENPVLQKWFAAAEALALGEEVAWTPEQDLLQPDVSAFAAAAPLLKAFGDAFTHDASSMGALPSAGVPKRTTAATKRSRDTDGAAAESSGGSKRARGGGEDDAISREAMLKAYDKGAIGKLKVPELKAFLKSQGLSTTGRKADLVALVEGSLGTPSS
jgi:ATP-dependent DNA helicase 2 subunit 1